VAVVVHEEIVPEPVLMCGKQSMEVLQERRLVEMVDAW
jgi:hypothetical protein